MVTISPAVATELVQPLLLHLEQLEDNEDEESPNHGDEDTDDEAKTAGKRNVSFDNYIAWGLLQV